MRRGGYSLCPIMTYVRMRQECDLTHHPVSPSIFSNKVSEKLTNRATFWRAVFVLTSVWRRDFAYVLMQGAMSLDTHRSCTVYLHTGKPTTDVCITFIRRVWCSVNNESSGLLIYAGEERDINQSWPLRGKEAQKWLTGAAEALLADTKQHGVAVVTVRWLVEVFQTPNMLPVFLDVLRAKERWRKLNCDLEWNNVVFWGAVGFIAFNRRCQSKTVHHFFSWFMFFQQFLQKNGEHLITEHFSTVSIPSRTSKGMVVRPPLIHSSSVTVPSRSKSISSIISFSIWNDQKLYSVMSVCLSLKRWKWSDRNSVDKKKNSHKFDMFVSTIIE